MNPGATTSPLASTIVSPAAGFTLGPTSAMRSLTKRTFARKSGAPVPSATSPLTIVVAREMPLEGIDIVEAIAPDPACDERRWQRLRRKHVLVHADDEHFFVVR